MKAHSRNFIEWMGKPIDPIWDKKARESHAKIIQKWCNKQSGSVQLELVCFLIVTGLFISTLFWLVLTVWRER